MLRKNDLPRAKKKCTRQKASLPSAKTKALGKIHLCRVPEKNTRQRHILPCVFVCRVPDKIHSAKPRHSANRRFPVVIVVYPHLSIIVHRHRIESSASSFIGILCMATQNSTCSTSSSSEYCKYLGMETRAMHGMKVPFETSRKL